MGMCLVPTPDMGSLATEVRSRSVTIFGDGVLVTHDGVVEVDIKDLPKLRAALDQIEQYLQSKS